jgi:hypothetical protein
MTQRRAFVDDHVQPVAEGEEGVAGHRRAGQRQAGIAGLDAGDAGAVDAAHLAGAHAQRHAAGAEHDGIALDELGHLPGEQQVVHLRGVGASRVTTRSSAGATFLVSASAAACRRPRA